MPYASLHNFGGVSKSEKITLTVQQRIGKWLAKQSEDLQERLGWLLGDQARDQQLERHGQDQEGGATGGDAERPLRQRDPRH